MKKKAEEALKISESEMRALFAAMKDVILVYDEHGRCLKIAPTNPDLPIRPSAEFIGKTLQEVFPQAQADSFLDAIRRALATKNKVNIEYALPVNGAEVWFAGTVSPMTEHTVIWAARDITEHKLSDKEMKKLSAAVEQSTDAILIADRRGTTEYVNKVFLDMIGYAKEEIIGRNPRKLGLGSLDEKFYAEMWGAALAGRSFTGIMAGRKKTGELIEAYHTITPLKDDAGHITHFVATFKDITRQRHLEERINHLAYYDSVTGLPNRTLFLDRLTQAILRAEYNGTLVDVLVMDVDRFKLINEAFGLQIGDIVLKEIARRLAGLVREGETIARLGSGQFGIVLSDMSRSEDVVLVVERIRRAVSLPIQVDDMEIGATLSIGISICPADGKDAHALLQNAKMASMRVKDWEGNNYQFYTPDMNEKASQFALMERRLVNAVKQDEFVLHYQPYFDMHSKKMAGMEALIRLQSKDRGLIFPDKFIPVLEETRMIIEVGEWVLTTALRQLAEWRNKGYAVVPVSVNLSLIQFRQKDLADMVMRVIGASGVDPSLLVLEITESAFMEDIGYTSSVLNKMKDRGIAISIDDFGTGYSSLSYLQRFPVDNLKIDISFIRGIAGNPEDGSIVAAITSLAHTMKLKTIAEGIENEEQLNILRILRCDMAQGHYFSEPLVAGDVENLFGL